MTVLNSQAANAHMTKLSFDRCWFRAPQERSPDFLPAFAQVSLAAQAALRREIPRIFFEDLQPFRNLSLAYPMLIYAASAPYRSVSRSEFTWDILDEDCMRRFYLSVRRGLPAALDGVSRRLLEAGLFDLARYYRPDRSRDIIARVDRLKICRRRLETLLYAESVLVEKLVAFAAVRACSEEDRRGISARCEKVWLSRFRRLYARKDFTPAAPAVLSAAAAALRSYQQRGGRLPQPCSRDGAEVGI